MHSSYFCTLNARRDMKHQTTPNNTRHRRQPYRSLRVWAESPEPSGKNTPMTDSWKAMCHRDITFVTLFLSGNVIRWLRSPICGIPITWAPLGMTPLWYLNANYCILCPLCREDRGVDKVSAQTSVIKYPLCFVQDTVWISWLTTISTGWHAMRWVPNQVMLSRNC